MDKQVVHCDSVVLLCWLSMSDDMFQIDGLQYEDDKGGAAKDRVEEAVKWLKKAALAGQPRAQYSLALCLQQGRGTKKAEHEAVSSHDM